jgi:hypothetical protein
LFFEFVEGTSKERHQSLVISRGLVTNTQRRKTEMTYIETTYIEDSLY